MKTNPDDLIEGVFEPMSGTFHGLTKREFFAAMAISGVATDVMDETILNIVKRAVKLADALIEELNKEKK